MPDFITDNVIEYNAASFVLLYRKWRQGIYTTSIEPLDRLFSAWHQCNRCMSKAEQDKIQQVFERAFLRIIK